MTSAAVVTCCLAFVFWSLSAQRCANCFDSARVRTLFRLKNSTLVTPAADQSMDGSEAQPEVTRRAVMNRQRYQRRRRTTSTTTTSTTTTTTASPTERDYYEYDDYYDDYEDYRLTTSTTTTTAAPKRRRGGRRRFRRPTEPPTTTTTTTLSPGYKQRSDGRVIDYMADPNFPYELRGSDLTEYPFYITIPESPFNCKGRHDGYYADIELKCQVYHHCAVGHQRYDFLCPNYTLFDQTTFTCRFINTVDCSVSELHYNRNNELYVESTTTGTPLTTTTTKTTNGRNLTEIQSN